MIPLQAAWRTRDEWSRTLASLTAWTMSLTMDVELDWDPDEEWLTINKNGTWTGYLNADIPPPHTHRPALLHLLALPAASDSLKDPGPA